MGIKGMTLHWIGNRKELRIYGNPTGGIFAKACHFVIRGY